MHTPARGRWPAGLFGMIALVGGIESYVADHGERFTTHHAAAWKRSGEVVDRAARCAVVALGDSLVKHGFVPPVAATAAGRSVYNLAVPKGMFPAHDFLLRRLLRTGARPEALVVDGEMLHEDPFANPRVWPEMLTLAESAELAVAGRDPDFLAGLALAKLLPSLKARHEVRLALTKALEGTEPEEPRSLPVLWRNWRRNGGAQVFADRDDPPGRDPRPADLERAGYRPDRWVCRPVNAKYIDSFLRRARANDIPVFWLLPPYHPEVEARRQRYGWYPQYVAFLRRVVARYPNVTVVDGRAAGYPPEALFDMTHLSRTGALTYSDAVGRLIGDRLDGAKETQAGRWVALPRYDPARAGALAAASTVEDLRTSGVELTRVMAEVHRAREGRRVAGHAPAGEPEVRR